MAQTVLSGQTPEQLIATYRKLWSAVSVRWGVTLTNSVYAMLAIGLLGSSNRRLLGGLLIGGPPNRSLLAVRAAVGLAERVGTIAPLRDAVLAGEDPRAVWADLAAGRYGQEIADAATDFVRRYGDRAMHDLKLEEPTPRQRPWMVLELIRPYLQQELTVAGLTSAEPSLDCRNPLRRMMLKLIARVIRASIRIREDTRFCRTQLYGLSRQIMWQLGEQLFRAGRLDDPMDVCDLTIDEVMGAFDGTLAGTDLRALAGLRRVERLRYALLPARAALLATQPDQPLALALERASTIHTAAGSADGRESLRGLGSCAGVVRAPARVVLDPAISPDSCRDTILIARETDPGWLFLMMAAKGLVVERGTLLSHTAITGRLLGIPTIVAVPGATTRIQDGALIEIDGSAGTIRLIEGPAQ